MQIEIFTVCDSAQVYAGKAVILGAFNQIKVKKLPAVVPNLTLAVRVALEKEEAGDKSFFFDIKNPDGTTLVPELCCEAKQVLPQEQQVALLNYDMNIVLNNIPLCQFGVYVVTMRLDEKKYFLKFYVLEDK